MRALLHHIFPRFLFKCDLTAWIQKEARPLEREETTACEAALIRIPLFHACFQQRTGGFLIGAIRSSFLHNDTLPEVKAPGKEPCPLCNYSLQFWGIMVSCLILKWIWGFFPLAFSPLPTQTNCFLPIKQTFHYLKRQFWSQLSPDNKTYKAGVHLPVALLFHRQGSFAWTWILNQEFPLRWDGTVLAFPASMPQDSPEITRTFSTLSFSESFSLKRTDAGLYLWPVPRKETKYLDDK